MYVKCIIIDIVIKKLYQFYIFFILKTSRNVVNLLS